MSEVQEINGTLETHTHGVKFHFIRNSLGEWTWTQWGAPSEVLATTVGVLDAIVSGLDSMDEERE